jgi:ABC-2 type transport system ATP-binding protein
MRTRRAIATLAAVTLAATGTSLRAPSAEAASGTVTHGCLDSRPEPGSTEPVRVCYSLFKPDAATRSRPVPMVMHSHGWGGSRTQDPAAFDR